MNEITKPALVLTIITLVASLCLGVVYEVTKEPIAIQQQKTQSEAMQKVLADADSFEAVDTELTGTIVSVNAGYKGGELVGYVVNVQPGGFGGVVDTMVGVSPDGTVTGLTVIKHSETPGLGAHSTDEEWQAQFAGTVAPIAVTKDGGQIQAITSATITSRAVANGANEACEWVAANGGAN